jgi:uncharacterized protein (DUF2267 family)
MRLYISQFHFREQNTKYPHNPSRVLIWIKAVPHLCLKMTMQGLRQSYFLVRLRRPPMSTVGLESIEHTVQLTHKWINDLDERLGWEDKHRSFRLLRTVLQALRDWLSVNAAAGFGAQLPELLRGIYYEHWRPVATPVKQRHKGDFIARVNKAFKTDPILFTSEAITAVFELLSEKITAGEIEHIRHALPADIRALWPVPSSAA